MAKARRDRDKPPRELVAEFQPLRARSLVLLRSLREDQLERGGTHPAVGRLTVNDLVHEWVHHDAEHLRQAYANVQRTCGRTWVTPGASRAPERPLRAASGDVRSDGVHLENGRALDVQGQSAGAAV